MYIYACIYINKSVPVQKKSIKIKILSDKGSWLYPCFG